MSKSPENSHGCCHKGGAADSPVAVDPVCGMSVDPAQTAHHAEVDGIAFHFCSAGCRTKFVADPQTYLNPTAGALGVDPTTVAEGTIWTCPMHAQIRQVGPGSCPICGMALEPLEPTLEEGPNLELIDFTRRLWVSAILAVPLVILAMGTELFGWSLLPMGLSMWVQLALATPVVLWAAKPFFERGWESLRPASSTCSH